MATLKLKKPAGSAAPARASRAPVRGSAPRKRPTLAEAQAQRATQHASGEPTARGKKDEPSRAQRAAQHARPDPNARRKNDEHPQPQRGAHDQRAKPHDRRKTDEATQPQRGAHDQRAKPHDRRRTDEGPPHQRGSQHQRVEPRARRTDPSLPARPDVRRDRRGPPPRAPAPHHDHDPPPHAPGSLRLSKRISELGLASRREADEWIARGWVRVDGRVVDRLGARVLPDQQITIDPPARRQQAERVTILVNKPVGFVSGQAEDGYEPAVVLVTPANHWRDDHSGIRFDRAHLRGLAPAGRLDIDSVGLLVLTQDGRIARQLIGDDSAIEKEYLVRVQPLDPQAGRPGDDALALLRHGLTLDDKPLEPARVEWINDDQLRFVLREGRKRQIRRMCEAVGLEVTGLKRVRIGRVALGDLPPGQWRYLGSDESFD